MPDALPWAEAASTMEIELVDEHDDALEHERESEPPRERAHHGPSKAMRDLAVAKRERRVASQEAWTIMAAPLVEQGACRPSIARSVHEVQVRKTIERQDHHAGARVRALHVAEQSLRARASHAPIARARVARSLDCVAFGRGTCVARATSMSTKPHLETSAKEHLDPHATSHHRHPAHEAGGAAGGAIAGAALGAIAGPAGVAAGAMIGGVVGALVARVADEEADRTSLHDAELDAIIGVDGGTLGAPNLKHPPAVRGTYSLGSAGACSVSGRGEADGPIPAPEE